MRPHRILLTGFMGAGKSTVGRLLAPRLGWRFEDADDHIVARAGHSISEIFSLHGEAHFRALEAESVERLLQLENTVIALGGGALNHAETRARIAGAPAVLVVYLRTSLATSLERCQADTTAALRPVLQDRERLEARFSQRSAYYGEAHLTIDTDRLLPGDVVEQLLAALNHPPASAPGPLLR